MSAMGGKRTLADSAGMGGARAFPMLVGVGKTRVAALGYVDPGNVVGFSAIVAGLLLAVWGFYLRRHGRLRNLQGAAVSAGCAIFVGLVAMSVGTFFIVRDS